MCSVHTHGDANLCVCAACSEFRVRNGLQPPSEPAADSGGSGSQEGRTKPDPNCANCDGRGCMGCVLREWDHDCANDCPFCCEDPSPSRLDQEGTP